MMRRNITNNNYTDQEEESSFITVPMPKKNASLPSAQELMNDSVKSGYCQKRNNSMLVYYFPCIFPKWKNRYFILVGNYLFRYSSEHGESPKGVPIPIDSVTVRHAEEDCCFTVSMIRKVYTMKVASEDECSSWIDAIRERKTTAIRESLGHAPVNSSVKGINKAGFALFNKTLERDSTGYTENPLQSL
jgi:hypothetical protein